MASGHKDDEVRASRAPHVQWAPAGQRSTRTLTRSRSHGFDPTWVRVRVRISAGALGGYPCSSLRTFRPRGSSFSYWCDTYIISHSCVLLTVLPRSHLLEAELLYALTCKNRMIEQQLVKY